MFTKTLPAITDISPESYRIAPEIGAYIESAATACIQVGRTADGSMSKGTFDFIILALSQTQFVAFLT
jgi:hypothetical protein